MKNGEHLYEKLGEVNEKYVDEAEKYAGGSVKDKKRKKGVSDRHDRQTYSEEVEGIVTASEKRRIRIIPAAAAACLVIGAVSVPFISGRNPFNSVSLNNPETDEISNGEDDSAETVTDSVLSPSQIFEMNSQTNEYELVYSSSDESGGIYSWPVETAICEIADYLSEQNGLRYRTDGIEMFINGGYTLYLTTDRNIQNELDNSYLVRSEVFPQSENDEGELIQSAAVVMDYKGHILGVEGGLGEKTANLLWNRAYEGGRQPGSIITPLSAYGYAIENGLLTYSSVVNDEYLPDWTAENFEKWPQNYDGEPSGGSYPACWGLSSSLNTFPAQILYNGGNDIIQDVYDFSTQKLHLDLEPEDNDYFSLALGYTKLGPGVINLANAYMPYGNGGKYYEASIISRCTDASGNVIIDNESREGEQAVSEETAFIMNKMLAEAVDKGTGTGAQLENTVVAGKTGTTEDWRDITFVGMTPDYVSAIWVGYDRGTNQRAIETANSAVIWKDVFGRYADEHVKESEFPECQSVVKDYYCRESGKRANPGCWNVESLHDEPVGTGYYRSTDEFCDIHS